MNAYFLNTVAAQVEKRNRICDTGVLKMEEQIVRTYADMVYRIAYRYVKNSIDTDDVFSEVFLAYFKRKRTFESEEHRKAWLIRVTINCAKDLLGQRSQVQQLHEEAVSDQSLRDEDAYMDLHKAIEQLRPEYREVIKFYYLDELSVREIAQILDKNENTIKTHLSRARDALRLILEV
jgi:RNA polymerase sigma-70 factor (ECF subfamily)